jgi:hypothetical protein
MIHTSKPATVLANRHTDRFVYAHEIGEKIDALLSEIPLYDASIQLRPVMRKALDHPIEPFQGVHLM